MVRKGERVTYSTYVMHRRADIWGEDVLEWKPERWEGRRLGWEFGGFSGGARVCIGREFFLSFSPVLGSPHEAAFCIVCDLTN